MIYAVLHIFHLYNMLSLLFSKQNPYIVNHHISPPWFFSGVAPVVKWSSPRHLVELPFQQRRQGPCHVFSAKEQTLRRSTGQLKRGGGGRLLWDKSTKFGIIWTYLPQVL